MGHIISVFEPEVVLEDSGHSGCHQSFAQAHYVTDEHAVSLVQMVGRYLHRCRLEVKQAIAEDPWDLILGQAGAGFVREVVSHLEVDVIRRYQGLPRPALLNDL